MENTESNLGLLLVFALLAFAYMGWTYRTQDPNEFHTVNRRAGFLRIFASLFTVVGASEFVVFTTLAYLFGWFSLSFFGGAFAGFCLLYFLVPSIRERAQELDHHSIPDFAASQSLISAARLLSLTSVVFTCALVLIQVLIGTRLIENLTGAEFSVIALLLVGGVFIYIFWGGLQALLYTDVVQGVVLFVFTLTLALFLGGGLEQGQIQESRPALGLGDSWIDLTILFIGGMFAIAGGPEIWQRIVTCKDEGTTRKSLLFSGVTMLVWGLFVVWLGTSIRSQIPDADPDTAFFDFLSQGLPEWVLGLVLVMLLAAIMSTADTELFTAGVIIHKELQRFRPSDGLTMTRTRLILAAAALLVFGMTYIFRDNILNIYLGLVYLTFITGPIAFAVLFKRGGRSAVVRGWIISCSIALSLAVFSWLLWKNLLLSWYPALILPVSLLPLAFPGPKEGKE